MTKAMKAVAREAAAMGGAASRHIIFEAMSGRIDHAEIADVCAEVDRLIGNA